MHEVGLRRGPDLHDMPAPLLRSGLAQVPMHLKHDVPAVSIPMAHRKVMHLPARLLCEDVQMQFRSFLSGTRVRRQAFARQRLKDLCNDNCVGSGCRALCFLHP